MWRMDLPMHKPHAVPPWIQPLFLGINSFSTRFLSKHESCSCLWRMFLVMKNMGIIPGLYLIFHNISNKVLPATNYAVSKIKATTYIHKLWVHYLHTKWATLCTALKGASGVHFAMATWIIAITKHLPFKHTAPSWSAIATKTSQCTFACRVSYHTFAYRP